MVIESCYSLEITINFTIVLCIWLSEGNLNWPVSSSASLNNFVAWEIYKLEFCTSNDNICTLLNDWNKIFDLKLCLFLFEFEQKNIKLHSTKSKLDFSTESDNSYFQSFNEILGK